eukprot:4448310-Pyramimonas_sp.AAC.2
MATRAASYCPWWGQSPRAPTFCTTHPAQATALLAALKTGSKFSARLPSSTAPVSVTVPPSSAATAPPRLRTPQGRNIKCYKSLLYSLIYDSLI